MLNHGEATHALQRRIRAGAISAKRGRSRDEQAAISGSLALLANLVMVWNTQKLQGITDTPTRTSGIQLSDLGHLGPMSTRHINFRGVFHFPINEFAGPILRKEKAAAAL